MVLAKLCVFGTAMSIKKSFLCFLIHECYIRSVKRYCFVRKYAAVPVQLLLLFEDTVLRRVFGPKRDEVTGEWRKLHNEELNDLYSLPNIVRVVK